MTKLHVIENDKILQFKDENQTISNIYNFKLYQYSKIFTQFFKKTELYDQWYFLILHL